MTEQFNKQNSFQVKAHITPKGLDELQYLTELLAIQTKRVAKTIKKINELKIDMDVEIEDGK